MLAASDFGSGRGRLPEIQEALLDRLDRAHARASLRRAARQAAPTVPIEKRLATWSSCRGGSRAPVACSGSLKSNFAERDVARSRIGGAHGRSWRRKERLIADLETLVRLREEQRKLLKRAPEIEWS